MIRAIKGQISWLFLISFSLLVLNACASLPNIGNIVPQIALPTLDNHALPQGKDIELANALLAAGKKREAAAAYFDAARNYRSPERERLTLQAAELAAIIKDENLAQRYLSPLRYAGLNPENQARFRFTQAQLALNDNNFRETLRILPQRVNNLPTGLAQKILNARMRAAQSSRDRISLVQELVLQEPTLKSDHATKLNHDRIWNHIQQIPRGKLNESRKHINHPVLRNWLDLGYFARIAKNGSGQLSDKARGSILGWKQRNPRHPGNAKISSLLKPSPVATTKPYQASGDKPSQKSTTSTSHSGTQIAVILPLSGRLSSVGNTILQGIKEAHKQSPNNTHLKIYNAESSPINNLYKTAVSEGADLVIGPFNKNRIYSLAKTNLDKPVLGLNYIQDSNTSNSKLKQFGLLPEDEAVQMAQFALNQGQKRIALLTPSSTWGQRLRDAMRTAVIERGGKVVIMKSYIDGANSYTADAKNLAFRSDELDAILMIASPSQAQRLYPALRQEIKRLPVYASSHVFSGVANATTDSNLEGLIFTETPWVLDRIKSNTGSNVQSSSPRLFALGMDAYLITKSLNNLQSFSSAINGKTGRIRLSKDGTMHRTLRWAQFRNGVPVAIR